MRPNPEVPIRDMTELNVYYAMVHRCTNKNHHKYKDYGGRGITVCARWLESFKNFYEDMGERPSMDHSLDRIDNNEGYSIDNCRWATPKEQSRNQRSNRILEAFGKSQCLVEWAEELGIPTSTLDSRLNKRGWCVTKALLLPKKNISNQAGKPIPEDKRQEIATFKDSGLSQRKVAKKFGVSKTSVRNIWNSI